MRLSVATISLLAATGASMPSCTAFTSPSTTRRIEIGYATATATPATQLYSTAVRAPPTIGSSSADDESGKRIWMDDVPGHTGSDDKPAIVPPTADEINARLQAQLEKLRQKDKNSIRLSKEDLKIIYEDDYIVVVDKPSGVLTVSGKDKENPSLAQAVYDAVGDDTDLPSGDHMVVHRLGMDTSGLLVFAKNLEAVRGMNGVFRERKVERQYEALVVGRMAMDEGLISLPIMRDYEFPPYVRISTYDHQYALIDLDPEDVGKKLLEGPKESLTKYEVVSREEFGDDKQPVTRVKLTSISGRYHQLNVHLAAFGHPIVGDTVYGINGDAAANGGLTDSELRSLTPNPNRASNEVQRSVAESAKGMAPCVHAKSLKFRHPVTNEDIELSTDSPF